MSSHKSIRWPWGIGLDKRQARRYRRRLAIEREAMNQTVFIDYLLLMGKGR